MRYSIRFADVRLLLIIGCLGILLPASFLNFKAVAQSQDAANTNPNPSPTASPLPTPISISLIIGEKEKTDRRVREIGKIFTEQLPVVRLQTDVSELLKDFDAQEEAANTLLGNNPSLDALDKNEKYWNGISLSLPSRKKRVQAQTADVSAKVDELQNLLNVWELTRKSLETAAPPTAENISEISPSNGNVANVSTSPNKKLSAGANRNANANANANIAIVTNAANVSNAATNTENSAPIQLPENLNAQIADLFGRIRQTQAIVRFKLGEIIKLQEKVSDAERRTDQMLNKISVARSALLSNLTVRDAAPIWSRENFVAPFEQLDENSFAGRFAALNNYLFDNRGLSVVHLSVIAILILFFRRARRKTRQLVEEEPKLKNGLIIFEHPLASSLVLGLLFGPLIYKGAPDLFGLLASPILVLAIFFLFRHLIDRPYLPILVALVALYLVNNVRLFVAPIPILTRTVFLLEMIGGIGFLIWLIYYHRPPPEVQYAGTIRKLAFLLFAPFTVALLANAFGYVTLADVIGKAIVYSLGLGLILYAFVRIADSLLIFILRLPPFSKLGMVKNHRPLVQKKIFQVIKWTAILAWFIFSLIQSYLADSFVNAADKTLEYEIGTKTFSISLNSVLAFVLIIWFSFLLSRFVRFALEQDVYPRVHLASGLPYATSTILHYLLLLAGVFLALAAAGIDLTKFTIFIGALGVGVGIGLQNIVENFTSGLILLLERPVKIGDAIQMKDHQGELTHIGLRASVVKTFDGAEVIVPNGQLITEEVTNWTLSDERRRLDIDVGIEYGNDPERIIELLESVAANHPEVDRETAPRALFLGFGENALNFQLRAWTMNHGSWSLTKSDLTVSVYKALKEAGIQIPFPQRDLHLKSVDKSLLKGMNFKSGQ